MKQSLLLQLFQNIFSGQSSYFNVLFKMIGITYICEFGAAVCKDAGYAAVAGQIEIIGKVSIVFAGLPVLFTILDEIQGLI